MAYDDLSMEDPDFNTDSEHATVPSPVCDADVECRAPIEVIFLRTGEKMCAVHALDHCGAMVSRDREERAERDTDRAPLGGSPTLPPIDDGGDDDSPAPVPTGSDG